VDVTARILIVDDNPTNLKLVAYLVKAKGYDVDTAPDAETALAAIRARAPRLILMDVQLPGIDGVEALGRLRSDAATAAIPVVALTALAMKEDRERFLAAGFDGYLEKPVSVPELADRVAALIAR
jgi:two-component system cell cycle response regulator DivK